MATAVPLNHQQALQTLQPHPELIFFSSRLSREKANTAAIRQTSDRHRNKHPQRCNPHFFLFQSTHNPEIMCPGWVDKHVFCFVFFLLLFLSHFHVKHTYNYIRFGNTWVEPFEERRYEMEEHFFSLSLFTLVECTVKVSPALSKLFPDKPEMFRRKHTRKNGCS